MNDLNYVIEGTSLRLYADDTTAYASDISPVVLEYIINSNLQVVCTWLQHNYLQINATKTQTMAIDPVNYRYTINLQDNNIEQLTDSLKILGVTLDERITFKPYSGAPAAEGRQAEPHTHISGAPAAEGRQAEPHTHIRKLKGPMN